MSVFSQSENTIKKVQGLQAKRNYNEALSLCNQVLSDLRPIALHPSDDTDAIQLMAVALGEISEIYEKKKEIQRALEYKKLQRNYLDFVKIRDSMLNGKIAVEFDEADDDDDDEKYKCPSRQSLIDKLDEVQNMHISLSDNPDDAMRQIMESLQRAKEKKLNEAMESIFQSNNNPGAKFNRNNQNDNLGLSKWERSIEYVFDHPLIVVVVILALLTTAIVLITMHFKSRVDMSDENQKRIHEITDYISKMQNVKNREDLKKLYDGDF